MNETGFERTHCKVSVIDNGFIFDYPHPVMRIQPELFKMC